MYGSRGGGKKNSYYLFIIIVRGRYCYKCFVFGFGNCFFKRTDILNLYRVRWRGIKRGKLEYLFRFFYSILYERYVRFIELLLCFIWFLFFGFMLWFNICFLSFEVYVVNVGGGFLFCKAMDKFWGTFSFFLFIFWVLENIGRRDLEGEKSAKNVMDGGFLNVVSRVRFRGFWNL